MRRIDREEFEERLKKRKVGEQIDFTDLEFADMDFSKRDFSNINFALSMFVNVRFDGTDLSNVSFQDAQLDGCSLRMANFEDTNLQKTTLRGCDMTGCNLKGADLFCAVLENAVLDDVITDERTKWFRLYCPEQGAFLAYKKCVNDRLVQLLVPADAMRTSATNSACRCSKAKVLTIKSFDYTQEFDEAWSLVDEDFVYRKGEWLEIPDFNEDRWFESTTGIHIWLTREEAMKY